MTVLDVKPQPVPLDVDPAGVVRVSGTRVTLASVVSAFRDGATPEQIVQQYPSVDLPDVYAVVAYYVRHPVEVDEYLREYAQVAAEVRQESERRFDPRGVRQRLLARSHTASTG